MVVEGGLPPRFSRDIQHTHSYTQPHTPFVFSLSCLASDGVLKSDMLASFDAEVSCSPIRQYSNSKLMQLAFNTQLQTRSPSFAPGCVPWRMFVTMFQHIPPPLPKSPTPFSRAHAYMLA